MCTIEKNIGVCEMENLSTEIGNKLRLLREENGHSVRFLASKIAVPKSTINSYENGEFDQKIGPIKKIATFYNEDVNWIIGETDNRRSK
jgi:transcriptional regulator with XRE-family HTH domain